MELHWLRAIRKCTSYDIWHNARILASRGQYEHHPLCSLTPRREIPRTRLNTQSDPGSSTQPANSPASQRESASAIVHSQLTSLREGLEDARTHGEDVRGVYGDLLQFLPLSNEREKYQFRVTNNVSVQWHDVSR